MASSSTSTDAKEAGRWTIAIFALIGFAIGLAVFAVRAPTYTAETLVAVSNPAGSLEQEIAVVRGPLVLGAVTESLGFEPDIDVQAAQVASLLTITASAEDAELAALAANTVAATYVRAQLGAAANVAQQASVPTSSSGPNLLVFAAAGSVLGALLGLAVQSLRSLGGSSTNANADRVERPPKPVPPQAPPAPLDLQATQPTQTIPPIAPAAATQPAQVHEYADLPEQVLDVTDSRPQESPDVSEPPHSFSNAAMSSGDAATNTPAAAGPHDTPDAFTETSWLQPEQAQPLWSRDPESQASAAHLEDLDRQTLLAQFESARYELLLDHNEQLARNDASHEQQVAVLRSEVGDLTKQLRMQEVRLKNRSGTDQHRVGDLEAQTIALESELAANRQTLERERIAHTQKLTEERGAADRALDNARRQYREELSKHVHTHRQALADHRSDLDSELAQDRAKHAAALEAQHHEYERQLEAERNRLDTRDGAALERHKRELADLRAANRQELDQQALQHKDTIESLREVNETSDLQLRELEKQNRALRVDNSTQLKQARHADNENSTLLRRLNDEISVMRGELVAERERNTALRADVIRRSAEAHQAIDRAVEERTAQMSELEASVARQREYADRRVQETSAAAEERARQAAMREADLTATISRLKRDLVEAQRSAEES